MKNTLAKNYKYHLSKNKEIYDNQYNIGVPFLYNLKYFVFHSSDQVFKLSFRNILPFFYIKKLPDESLIFNKNCDLSHLKGVPWDSNLDCDRAMENF